MTLPLPPLALQQHSQQLTARICQQIATYSAMPFVDYMQLALYEPELGYYSAGMQKFGSGGDFITAPEISPLFAQCLARYIQPVIHSLKNANILEFGAGSGKLAADLLMTLADYQVLPEHYYILEVSAELRSRQQHTLATTVPQFMDRIVWLDRLPTHINGVIVANEVLDAMPVRRFCYREQQFWEYAVQCTQGILHETLIPPSEQLTQALASFPHQFPENYSSEINTFSSGWLAGVADVLRSGLVLLIDYGFPQHEYYHPDRSMGTLMCHYQHRAHNDPYFWPGLQDITAHVDFTAVATAATAAGFNVSVYTNQANFLLNCGITELAAHEKLSTIEAYTTSQAVKKLLLPSEMGELFKVMALTKNYSEPSIELSRGDLRHKL